MGVDGRPLLTVDIILLFPGQGSQKPGMGKDLAGAFPVARGVFGEVDAALGADISRLCFEGPADELTATKNAQPALFAHGAAVWAITKDALYPHVRAAAGHSLGEFTAYHAADAISLPGAARLVRRRGELMFETGTAQVYSSFLTLIAAIYLLPEAIQRARPILGNSCTTPTTANCTTNPVTGGNCSRY